MKNLGNLECTAKPLGKWLCSKPLTGTSASFSASSRQRLWSQSSLQLFLPESLLCTLAFLSILLSLGRRCLVNLLRFRDSLNVFWVVCLFASRASLQDELFQVRKLLLNNLFSGTWNDFFKLELIKEPFYSWCLMRLSGWSASWRSYRTNSVEQKRKLWFTGWEKLNFAMVTIVQKLTYSVRLVKSVR